MYLNSSRFSPNIPCNSYRKQKKANHKPFVIKSLSKSYLKVLVKQKTSIPYLRESCIVFGQI